MTRISATTGAETSTLAASPWLTRETSTLLALLAILMSSEPTKCRFESSNSILDESWWAISLSSAAACNWNTKLLNNEIGLQLNILQLSHLRDYEFFDLVLWMGQPFKKEIFITNQGLTFWQEVQNVAKCFTSQLDLFPTMYMKLILWHFWMINIISCFSGMWIIK